jgi:hypothetical protein
MIHLVIEYYDIPIVIPSLISKKLIITFQVGKKNRRIWHKPLVADLRTNENKSISDTKLTRFYAKID